MPLTEICNATYGDPRQRQLFKNIIYLGALSALLDIDPRSSRACSARRTRARSGCWTRNVKALHLGRDFATDTCSAAPRSA